MRAFDPVYIEAGEARIKVFETRDAILSALESPSGERRTAGTDRYERFLTSRLRHHLTQTATQLSSAAPRGLGKGSRRGGEGSIRIGRVGLGRSAAAASGRGADATRRRNLHERN
jgi:hypothetical protein